MPVVEVHLGDVLGEVGLQLLVDLCSRDGLEDGAADRVRPGRDHQFFREAVVLASVLREAVEDEELEESELVFASVKRSLISFVTSLNLIFSIFFKISVPEPVI